ncbi:MAG: DUF2203 domain-containing protein [Actinomycetota bacterium]
MSGVPGSVPFVSYTRDEANALLPELTDVLIALREAYADVAGHAEAVRSSTPGNGGSAHAQAWADSRRSLDGKLAWLRSRGIQLKDLERGLVDFPSVRDGRPVLLCWLLGEPSVDFWHELSTGFAGRRPL